MAIRFYFDIVCPYAYMASERIEELALLANEEVDWRPVLLGGVFRSLRSPDVPAAQMSAARARLNMLDIHRQADRLGLKIQMPLEHPRRTVECMRLILASPKRHRRRLVRRLYKAYWEENLDVSDRAVLHRIAAEFEIDPACLDSETVKQALFDATAVAVEDGVFGVPAAGVDEQIWWGVDRMHFLAKRLGVQWSPFASPASEKQSPSSVVFFHDFSSPFSYLASTQVARVAAETGAQVEWRPILLGALFREIGTANVPLLEMSARKQAYYLRDMKEWADWWGVPFRVTEHFPLRTVTALRVALVEPKTTPVLYEAAWARNVNIGEEALLVKELNEAGFDGEALVLKAKTPDIKQRLRENTESAVHRSVCGVPSFLVDDEMLIWGQDRLDQLEWAIAGWRPTQMQLPA